MQDGDVALRGNFGTVDDNMVIQDRRAGRIRVVEPLTKALDGLQIDDVTLVVKPGTAHRGGVVMRGPGLSSAVTDADPHEVGQAVWKVKPTDDSPEAKRTAKLLNKFVAKTHEILAELEFNKERQSRGELPGNCLLLRGAGQYRSFPSFKERFGFTSCCVAGGGLYKGIGAFLGMDIIEVPGATALPDSDVKAKFKTALKQLGSHDFVFIHVKAADSLGEDGDPQGKAEFIAKCDKAMSVFDNLPKDGLLVVTADHSTPCELKQHSADPVPVMFYGEGVRTDDIVTFGERACAKGGLGHIEGKDIMPQIQNLMGHLHLIGA
jgi:2,3-bisphosphoglycerate-independent phosphoglycerate mutase